MAGENRNLESYTPTLANFTLRLIASDPARFPSTPASRFLPAFWGEAWNVLVRPGPDALARLADLGRDVTFLRIGLWSGAAACGLSFLSLLLLVAGRGYFVQPPRSKPTEAPDCTPISPFVRAGATPRPGDAARGSEPAYAFGPRG